MAFCIHCGAEVAQDATFCHSCGGAVRGETPAPSGTPVEAQSPLGEVGAPEMPARPEWPDLAEIGTEAAPRMPEAAPSPWAGSAEPGGGFSGTPDAESSEPPAGGWSGAPAEPESWSPAAPEPGSWAGTEPAPGTWAAGSPPAAPEPGSWAPSPTPPPAASSWPPSLGAPPAPPAAPAAAWPPSLQTPVPPPPPAPVGAPVKVPNYLVGSILSILCCCLPAGVVSLIYAIQANSKADAGLYDEAMAAANTARTWLIVAVALGLVVTVLGFGLQILGVLLSSQG